MGWQFFDWLLSPGFWVAASMTFTLLHIGEELCGRGGPLWDNFGKIVGVRLPDGLGFALFSVGLAAVLGVLALGGYGGGNATCLSVLLGARLGDALVSHWGLWLAGLSRPNPGIWTTPLYALEGAALLACWPLLAAGPASSRPCCRLCGWSAGWCQRGVGLVYDGAHDGVYDGAHDGRVGQVAPMCSMQRVVFRRGGRLPVLPGVSPAAQQAAAAGAAVRLLRRLLHRPERRRPLLGRVPGRGPEQEGSPRQRAAAQATGRAAETSRGGGMRVWFRFLTELSLRGTGGTAWCGVAATLAMLTGVAAGLVVGWLLVAALNAAKTWLVVI